MGLPTCEQYSTVTEAAALAADYRDAHRSLAEWVARQLDPLRSYGRKIVLTAYIEGDKVSVKIEPPPEAVAPQT